MRVPAQEGLWLDDLKDLLPVRQEAREEQQRQPVAPGQTRGLHLSMQDDQLLAKEGVLGEEFRAAAREIRQRAGDEVGASGLGEAAEELVGDGGQTCPQSLG